MNKQFRQLKPVQIVNMLALAGTLIINILSNALPLNGRTAGEISDALPSFFTPAGYTFSIWGLIYTALIGFAIYQALPQAREQSFLSQIGWLFVASSVANSAWIFAWHYGYYLISVVMMITLLLSLIAIYLRLQVGRTGESHSWQEKLLVHVPFSLYLGWITVATIANIASVATYLGWQGGGIAEPVWSAIMIAVAVVVAALVLFNARRLAYAGVLIWALFGIRAAYPAEALVANTAVVAAVLIGMLALLGYWRTRAQATMIAARAA